MSFRTAEIIMRSAELRLEEARASLSRLAFGDAEYHQEVKHVRVLEEMARYETPPVEPHKLPGWKRRRWALRLRGW